jgi:predicted adenine nucleotide alpha hydrolase (AANH) superfamily ATPase
MKLLLHICCGPCATATIPAWRQKGAEVTGFFHNPNIHPFLEQRRRLTGVRDVVGIAGVPLLEDAAYDPERWFAQVGGREDSRCALCIAGRLERTAEEAVARGCDAFSTTLSISPWQDHEAIQAGGERAARLHGVHFAYEDLRPLYPETRRLSREWGIYRQKYCGCLVSEWERYRAP